MKTGEDSSALDQAISFSPEARGRFRLQRPLTMGAANDPLEREADAAALRILGVPGSAQSVATEAIAPAEVPQVVHDALRSPGQALDPAARAFFEPRFRQDFSQVRVHADKQAAESADAIGADAFTVGRDIVFGVRQYVPDSSAGRGLLAHELAHVASDQAGGLTSGIVRRKPSGSWSERLSGWYEQKKWDVYRGLIAVLKSAKNASLNALRRQVPQLPAVMQSGVTAIINSIDFCLDMIIALLLAIIGLAVGFVEGIVGLVTGIVKLAYGLLKLAADYLWALFGKPDAYRDDVNGIAAAIQGIPAGLSKLIHGWLDRYKHATAEEQVLMGGELVGQIEALLASFAFSGAKAGQTASITADTGSALEDSVTISTGAVERAPVVSVPERAAPLQGASDAELDEALSNIESEGDFEQFHPHGAAARYRKALNLSGDDKLADYNRRALKIIGKDVQSAHDAPQSVMKRIIPGYNPGHALAKLMDKATHTGMDRYWEETFQAMQKAGKSRATAQEVYDVVAESIRRAPGLSVGQKSSRVARLADEMFVEYGLKPGDLIDLPYPNRAPH